MNSFAWIVTELCAIEFSRYILSILALHSELGMSQLNLAPEGPTCQLVDVVILTAALRYLTQKNTQNIVRESITLDGTRW